MILGALETPRGTVTVRPILLEDTARFRELRLEALRSHPEVFGADYDDSLSYGPEYWDERVRKATGEGDAVTYLAEADGEFVGMIGITRETWTKVRHLGNIWGVYVRPAWRGLGIIDALLTACLDWAREREVRSVRLTVVTTNAAAIRVYARHGFTVYGVDPEVIFTGGKYYDELMMVRML